VTDWTREHVKDLLTQAAALPADRRAAHIAAHAPDATVAKEALALLPTLEDGAFMAAPTVNRPGGQVAPAAQAAPDETAGQRIGRYKLLEQIGEGGFGTVFMAEQTEPVVRRVALKILKPGMDTRQVIARFEAERQALAMMDHPSIARVLDAGATTTGRPYFVMELVRGEPVTHYCDREQLALRPRLELFRAICQAVQHAHQKGIIHRDLKPSNVLVTIADGQPLPKVIDFGIAKATATRLTDKTLFTEMHQLIGTPEYMSPEQAEVSGVDIDTRSDIYALGVLLYELLTGTTPFNRQRLAASGFDGLRRILRDEEPQRPSVRLQASSASSARFRLLGPSVAELGGSDSSLVEIASRRRTEPAALARSLQRDLDWIALKCLEKERARRYETASALADDIRRYLDDRPVRATPPRITYKLRKFVRRHRGAMIAAVTVAATLLIAAGVSLAFGMSEAHQRAAAEIARDHLAQVAEFQEKQLSGIDARTMGVRLRTRLLEKARAAAERAKLPPEEVDARGRELEALIAGCDFTGLALEALDDNFFQPALAAIDKQFADQPLVRARLLQTLASTLLELGLVRAATGPQEAALAIYRSVLGGEHPDTLTSICNMGLLLKSQGKLAEAETYYREALQKCRRVLGEEHRSTLIAINSMGFLLKGQGKLAEAETYYAEALEKSRRVLGDEHPDTLCVINNMGVLLSAQGRYAEAEPYFREALEKRRRVLGADHPDTLRSLNNMGFLLQAQGKLGEAEPYLREALEQYRRVRGEEHPDTLRAINNMGGLLWEQGRPGEAEVYFREACEKRRRVLGEEHPDTLHSLTNVGSVLQAQGRLSDAEPYFREALEKSRRVLGDEHPDTLLYFVNLGDVLQVQGEYNQAIELLAPREPPARRVFTGDNTAPLGRLLSVLGCARAAAGEFAAAEDNLVEAQAIFQEAKDATDRDRCAVLDGLVQLYDAWGQPDKTDEYRRLLDETR
jgi:serine/threonine protein kinase/tetratricopeptide (TPR) repeat protein